MPATRPATAGPKSAVELVLAVGQILRRREQDAGDARLRVQPQAAARRGQAQRVFQRRLAGAEQLVRIDGQREFVGAAQPPRIGAGEPLASDPAAGASADCGLGAVTGDH